MSAPSSPTSPAAAGPVLSVRDLTVDFTTDEGTTSHAVRHVSFDIGRGEVLALVGESGSGKTVTSLAVTGLLPSTATVTGQVLLDGEDLLQAPERRLNEIRGRDIAMIFQEPMTALNPTMTVGRQITEVLTNHQVCSRREAWRRAVALLAEVGLPDPAARAQQYPHEFSGGQRQRVVIAIALAAQPKLIIADEPTTALDVTVQAEILDLMRELAAGHDTAFLLITHNMGVVSDVAHRVAVMYLGELVETGPAEQVLLRPRAGYSIRLLEAVPALPAGAWEAVTGEVPDSAAAVLDATAVADPALEFDSVSIDYRRGGGHVRAVSGVSLAIGRGEIVGLVGESGSGKSTLGRAALGLLAPAEGRIAVLGEPVRSGVRIGRAARAARGRVGIIFQDPGSSLDPRLTIAESVAEPLVIHGWKGKRASRAFRRRRVLELLDAVRLPAGYDRRFPHELSGGQRQRVSLARAVALDPDLLIADEPTSALDVSVQATVLELLQELQSRYGFACLFISHDLAVVNLMARRVAVMLRGRLVEAGPADRVMVRPSHPYTQRLLAAAPSPDPVEQARRREARALLAARERAAEVAA